MSKRPNFEVGNLVTWRECDGSWVKALKDRHGNGPFEVYDVTWKQYGTPHVKIMTQENEPILAHGEDPWLNSACFQLCEE